ncbi:MAG: NAD(P)H-dependent oxidoreductase [Myxococcales bacterium]|nr:NAD(P)H-dependent oxidoreductase [Myxococcales bacterium]
MSRVFVVYAHPYPARSRANARLLRALGGIENVEIHSLYERYPDFNIDVEAEQRALSACDAVVWQHPIFWYAPPAMMKLWFEKVLTRGWAYGGGRALAGKACLWMTTAGAHESGYHPDGVHGFAFERFVPGVEQTARFCAMRWLDPMVLFHAHQVSDAHLDTVAAEYRARVMALVRS